MAKQPYCYEYPRPAVTVDAALFRYARGVRRRGESLQVLLIERGSEPFAGRLALPGGFLDLEEEAEAGARRELREETGLSPRGPWHPLGFFARPGRDPRGRTISLAFLGVMPPGSVDPTGGDDAAAAAWHDVGELSVDRLAFDHGEMLARALERLGQLCLEGPLALSLLPTGFSRIDVARILKATGQGARRAASWCARMERAGLVRAEGRGAYAISQANRGDAG